MQRSTRKDRLPHTSPDSGHFHKGLQLKVSEKFKWAALLPLERVVTETGVRSNKEQWVVIALILIQISEGDLKLVIGHKKSGNPLNYRPLFTV